MTSTATMPMADLFDALRQTGGAFRHDVSRQVELLLPKFEGRLRDELVDRVILIQHELLEHSQSESMPENILEAAAVVFGLARALRASTLLVPKTTVVTCLAHVLHAAFMDFTDGPARSRHLELAKSWLAQVAPGRSHRGRWCPMSTRREEKRADLLVQAEINRQDRESKAKVKLDEFLAVRDADRQDRDDKRSRRVKAMKSAAEWAKDHVIDLLFVPVIGVPAVLSWTAMAAYGSHVFGPVG